MEVKISASDSNGNITAIYRLDSKGEILEEFQCSRRSCSHTFVVAAPVWFDYPFVEFFVTENEFGLKSEPLLVEGRTRRAPGSEKEPGDGIPSSASIDVSEFKFKPANVTVSVGGKVTWEFTGTIDHTTTGTGAEFWDSGLNTSGTFSRTFNSQGTFTYICAVQGHEQLGMTGTIIVK